MKIREYAKDYLTKGGMFPNDADTVLATVEAETKQMVGRWDEDTEGYPSQLLAVLRFVLNRAALDWIDEHCPQAFYRAMFE